MPLWGGYFRNVSRATNPPRLFTGGEHSKSRGPRRLLAVDLRSRSSRLSRLQSRGLSFPRVWWALFLAGVIVFLILHLARG